MGIDMKAFMKPELKDRGTMEFPGIERYKDAKERRYQPEHRTPCKRNC